VDFRRGTEHGFSGRVLAPSTINDLRDAMVFNPYLRVFSANGLYDLATPFAGTQYQLSHVGLPAALQSHVEFHLYPSGHMVYLREDARATFRADLGAFYDETDRSGAK